MGTGKKEASRKVRQGKVGDGMANVKVKGENFYRYVLAHEESFVDGLPLSERGSVTDIILQFCEEG